MPIAALKKRFREAVEMVIDMARHNGSQLPENMPSLLREYMWREPNENGQMVFVRQSSLEPCFKGLITSLERNSGNPYAKSPLKETLDAIRSILREVGTYPHWGLGILPDLLPRAMLEEYFDGVGKLIINDEEIQRTCEKCIADLKSDTAQWQSVYLVSSFSAESPFNLGPDIFLRPVKVNDLFKFGEETGPTSLSHGKPVPGTKDWLCFMEQTLTKEKFCTLHETLEDVVNALHLSVDGRVSFELLDKSTKSPYLRCGRIFGGIATFTSRSGISVHLSDDGIQRVQKAFEQISSINSSPSGDLALPLRRLRTASGRRDAADHLVDCVIGLENLLVPDKSESSYKFRMRAAALLPESFGDTPTRLDLMKSLYNKRSDIVHGSKGAMNDIEKSCQIAESALREITFWFLNEGQKIGSRAEIAVKLDEAIVLGGAAIRNSG